MRALHDLAASRGVSLGPKGQDFARAVTAIALGQLNDNDPADIATKRWGSARTTEVTKAAVNALTTSNAAADLTFTGAAAEFFAVVAERSIIGRLTGLRRVPFYVPALTATEAQAYWVGQGQAKPLSNMVFVKTSLHPRKVMGLAVVTKEVLESSEPAAEAVVRAELLRATVQALDVAFIDPANAGVADAMPASVTNGVSSVSYNSGLSNLATLIAAFDGDLTAAYLVMHPESAVFLSGTDRPQLGARGGSWAGVPVLTSRHVPVGTVVLLDPAGIAYAEGAPEQRVITQGSVLMNNAPVMASAELGSPQTPITGSMVSLWQTNTVAILTGRYANFEAIRFGSVAVMTGVGAGSP